MLTLYIFYVVESNLQLKPIFIAVSTLSPVRTQTLIPAYFNANIVSPTLSYNLSSMAVAPIRIKSFSISSCSYSMLSSLPSNNVVALLYF